MATGPLTGTRYATEFRAEISNFKVVGGLLAPARVRDKSARDESRRDTNGDRRGRNGTTVPASAASTTTVRIGGSKPHERGVRSAHKTSVVHPSPVRDIASSFGLAAMTRGDPPRIGRVKRNVRTPSDPGQPAGAAQTRDRRHTQGPVHAETAGSGRFGRYHPWCRSPAPPPSRASPIPELAVEQPGFRRVRSHHASLGSVLGAPTRGRPPAHRQRCLLSRRRALAARQRRTIGSTRGRWATLRQWQFRQDQPDTIDALTRARWPRPGPARRTPRRRTPTRTPPSGN